jgi:NitT/TauT family transport system permease protein
MKALLNILSAFPRYLWSGWGAIASILLFIALWELGFQRYGELILPEPGTTFGRLLQMLREEGIWGEMQITLRRALAGFAISALAGSLLGLVAGLSATASMMSRPIVTILMGMPPIAWIVLAMIWFGMGDLTVVFTVVVASLPIVFVGALQGTRTLDNQYEEMAASFHAPWWLKLRDIYFPHLFSFVFPAWTSALGMSWKIVVMAELLSTSDGIGAALATARSHLDTAAALALVVLLVGSLLLIEYLLMEPVKREVEQWRD